MDQKKKILVIDDDEAILEVVAYILKDEGYNVQVSPGGDIIAHLQSYQPDLIILDVLLGSKNGVQICKEVKNNPLTSYIPIIMFSAHASGSKISQECGADAFIEKPFDIEVLTKAVKKTLDKSEKLL